MFHMPIIAKAASKKQMFPQSESTAEKQTRYFDERRKCEQNSQLWNRIP
jgi:hypothetical protein